LLPLLLVLLLLLLTVPLLISRGSTSFHNLRLPILPNQYRVPWLQLELLALTTLVTLRKVLQKAIDSYQICLCTHLQFFHYVQTSLVHPFGRVAGAALPQEGLN